MKHKKTIVSISFLLLGIIGGLHAQESPTAAGGEATGTGGTSSYSVGQVVYTTATGTNLQGKVIANKKVTNATTIIKMEELAKALYFLNVTKNNKVVKSFKIIKN